MIEALTTKIHTIAYKMNLIRNRRTEETLSRIESQLGLFKFPDFPKLSPLPKISRRALNFSELRVISRRVETLLSYIGDFASAQFVLTNLQAKAKIITPY